MSDLSETEILPLGTHSNDGTIMCWGAAGVIGTGLNDSRSFVDVGLKQAQTLPRESRANVGIFRSAIVIEKMVEVLRALYPTKFISTQESYHSYDLPDINRATRSELYEIIRATMKDTLSAKECLAIADKILEIRPTLPTGLEDLDVLAKEVPAPVLKALKKAYIPFYVEEITEPRIKVEFPSLAVQSRSSTLVDSAPLKVDSNSELGADLARDDEEATELPILDTQRVKLPKVSIEEVVEESVAKIKPQAPIKASNRSNTFFSGSRDSIIPTPPVKDEFNTVIQGLRDNMDDSDIQLPVIIPKSEKPKVMDKEVIDHPTLIIVGTM